MTQNKTTTQLLNQLKFETRLVLAYLEDSEDVNKIPLAATISYNQVVHAINDINDPVNNGLAPNYNLDLPIVKAYYATHLDVVGDFNTHAEFYLKQNLERAELIAEIN